jgi:hypothetical protein
MVSEYFQSYNMAYKCDGHSVWTVESLRQETEHQLYVYGIIIYFKFS